MKALSIFMLAGLALTPLISAQALELNDNFELIITPALTTDYRVSGLSQTLGDPAAQLAVTLSHSSGLYAGIWTSNVNFGYGSKARQEIDYFAGYFWQINDNISLDTFYTQYEFPRESGYNQSDIRTLLDVYGVLLGGKYVKNMKGPDYEDEEGNFHKGKKDEDLSSILIGYRTVLPSEFGLEARYEYVDYKDDVFFKENGKSRANYYNWEIKLSREFVGVNWALSYIDTDLSKEECLSFTGFDDTCNATVVASASKTF
ncbi:TorF family putative porin [Pseudomonas sp. HY7a-MNA-CIBAN-0227]|uniref:TorF family putative porin n=1 Tax=Pseudomonas sp. HY7a-MNA-CIBAN-0227 TaxID=3140474 RepID=UPI0033330BB0